MTNSKIKRPVILVEIDTLNLKLRKKLEKVFETQGLREFEPLSSSFFVWDESKSEDDLREIVEVTKDEVERVAREFSGEEGASVDINVYVTDQASLSTLN